MSDDETARVVSAGHITVTGRSLSGTSRDNKAFMDRYNYERASIITKLETGVNGEPSVNIHNDWMDDIIVIAATLSLLMRFTDLAYFLYYGIHNYCATYEIDLIAAIGDDISMIFFSLMTYTSVCFPFKRFAIMYYIMGFVSIGLQIWGRDGHDFLPWRDQWKIDFMLRDIETGYIENTVSIEEIGQTRTAMKYTVICLQVICQLGVTVFVFGKGKLKI